MIITFVSSYRPITEWFSSIYSRFENRAIPVLRKKVSITSVHNKMMDAIGLIANGVLVFILFLAVVAFLCKWVVDQANKDAKKGHAEIISGKESSKQFSSRATLYVKNEAKAFDGYSGHLIMTSTTHTALYSKNKGIVIFPLANVARIEMPEKAIKGNGKVSHKPPLSHQ